MQGILVPLALPDLKLLHQGLSPDGYIEVHVIATTDRAVCPTYQSICVKIHDMRGHTIGIDEFARRNGHRYDTILCNLENRKVVEVSEGRT